MSKAIVRFLAILGALWLIGMVIVMVAVIGVKGKVPSKTILEANFEQPFLEDVPQTPAAQLLLAEKQTLDSRCCPKISRAQEICCRVLGNFWRVWSGQQRLLSGDGV